MNSVLEHFERDDQWAEAHWRRLVNKAIAAHGNQWVDSLSIMWFGEAPVRPPRFNPDNPKVIPTLPITYPPKVEISDK